MSFNINDVVQVVVDSPSGSELTAEEFVTVVGFPVVGSGVNVVDIGGNEWLVSESDIKLHYIEPTVEEAIRFPIQPTPKLVKPANPKQAFGDRKLPMHRVPATAYAYLALGFRDGAYKYGPLNWRETKVEATTYIAAAQRHILSWLDGEELTRDSFVPHLAAAMASLGVLVDAIETDNLIDDRPPAGRFADLVDKYELDDDQIEYLTGLQEARIKRESKI